MGIELVQHTTLQIDVCRPGVNLFYSAESGRVRPRFNEVRW
jgi:hypothetical protein